VVAAGRLVAQKGFDTLLRAFRRLRDARPARLVVLGEGPLRGELSALRDRLGLGDDVDFPGFVTNPYAVFARSACFALSSRFEGFGNVLVEAMACGTPVVTTRCPSGPPEIVTDGVDGLLVPVDDDAALAAAVGRVLADPAVAGALSRAGRVRAADFAADRVAGAYRTLFGEVGGVPVSGRAGAPA
jgi:glycosyltransferase involved in cell wall biosynthesis